MTKLRIGQAVKLRRLTTYDPRGGAERITQKHIADIQPGPDGHRVRFREGPYRWYSVIDDVFRSSRPTARYELVYDFEKASVSKRRRRKGGGLRGVDEALIQRVRNHHCMGLTYAETVDSLKLAHSKQDIRLAWHAAKILGCRG